MGILDYILNIRLSFQFGDTALALIIYALSIILFLKYKRDFMTPVLFFGLFLFPLQFSIWFLRIRLDTALPQVKLLEIVYIFFLKLSILVSLLMCRR
ncbi:MAG: hypothetical protein ACUVWJ_01400 [Spirochaetota bacterium]